MFFTRMITLMQKKEENLNSYPYSCTTPFKINRRPSESSCLLLLQYVIHQLEIFCYFQKY